jgi:hypothetical protein
MVPALRLAKEEGPNTAATGPFSDMQNLLIGLNNYKLLKCFVTTLV